MALIVEDGTGIATADSYASVTFADNYHAARGNTAWGDLDVEDKEIYLRRATDYLAVYRSAWKGVRTHSEQALDWPRANVPRVELVYGNYYAHNIVPEAVKVATAILALKASNGEPLAPDLDRAVVQEKVGSLSVTYDQYAPQQKRFQDVEATLSLLINGGLGPQVKVVRS